MTWKTIPGFETYEANQYGQIRNKKTSHVLKPQNTKRCDYLIAPLYKNGKQHCRLIHRIIAKLFVPNPSNLPCVNHKDENKQNNCASNLEWVTYKQNNNYGTRNKRISKHNVGKKYPGVNRTGTKVIARKNGKTYFFKSQRECARKLNLHSSLVNRVVNGTLRSTKGFVIERVYHNERNL